jgi:very-short-patch-repair endonuclease
VPYVERDGYHLTPIEVPIYKELLETSLTFSVQPWVQGPDRRYRVDFLVLYGGRAVAVELDGHEYHRTKEQRQSDAQKDRWLAERGIETLRWTGSEVYRDAQGCIRQLRDILRRSAARP